MNIRQGTVDDLATIIHHRRSMFYDMGYIDVAALDRMTSTAGPFLKAALEDGTYHAWLVEIDGNVVAGGGVLNIGLPSTTRDLQSRRAMILNMYTEPEHRTKGLARLIMEAMILWCREQGYNSVSLHASDAGRHLYESLGFVPTNEMRLRF
jgi:GNAT superfamily N-acetyltransferase